MNKKESIKTEELLSLLCHDLANPLQILSMSIETLEEKCSPDMQKTVERMKHSTESLTQILNLVRELQAFSAGKKELKMEAVSLDKVIEENMFNFQNKLDKKNILLKYNKKNPNTQTYVYAEMVSLSNNILKNIISNAIKFSPKNSIVDIFVEEKNDFVHVFVNDKGIGIPEELLSNIFSYNKETSRLGTNGEKGTGFGMPLVKLFLDLYQVDINIKSKSVTLYPDSHGTSIELIFLKA